MELDRMAASFETADDLDDVRGAACFEFELLEVLLEVRDCFPDP